MATVFLFVLVFPESRAGTRALGFCKNVFFVFYIILMLWFYVHFILLIWKIAMDTFVS